MNKPADVIVLAAKSELLPSEKVWGSELWVPPEQREALDWLTLSRLLGWETSVVRELKKERSPRCIVVATDPDRLGKEVVHELDFLLQNDPLVVLSRAASAADRPFAQLAGAVKQSQTVTGRSLHWSGPGGSRVWTCRNALESHVLAASDQNSTWATLEGQTVVAAKKFRRGTLITLGFHPSRARDADGAATALLKQLLICGADVPVAWLDLEGAMILRMDDPGGAQNVHLKSWSYPKLSEAEWLEIGTALKAHNARMTLSYIPGWVDDGDALRGSLEISGQAVDRIPGKIHPSPLVTYRDFAGNTPGAVHDYQSEFRGIQKLRAMGFCEVELHGHTHLHPNTIAWAKSADRYENPSWYHDLRVDIQDPTESKALQKLSLKASRGKSALSQGIDRFNKYFGVHPTTLICPQHVISPAAQMQALDLNFLLINSNYLAMRDHDRWCWTTHLAFADFDEPSSACFDTGLPAISYLHDMDVVKKGVPWFAAQLNAWRAAGARRIMDFREFAGALQRRVSVAIKADQPVLHIYGENAPPLVRPLSVLVRLTWETQRSNISVVIDDVELSLPIYMLGNGLGRVIIPCSPQTVSQKTRNGRIIANPNPITGADVSGSGITTLSWESEGVDLVEVHVDSPDGPLLSSATPSGMLTTGKWVRDGMTFFLQDVTGGLPLIVENTLATVTLEVDSAERITGKLYAFAAFLAGRFGCANILNAPCDSTNRLVALSPQFEVIGVGSGMNFDAARRQSDFGVWIPWDLNQMGRIPLPENVLQNSLIVYPQNPDSSAFLENLQRWLQYAPACIISASETSANLEHRLQSSGFEVEFSGSMTEDSEPSVIAILAGNTRRQHLQAEAPADFKVIAIMTAYNEEDIVVPSLQRLIDQGILIYFIDNWSTDSTYELAQTFEGNGLIGHERFPDQDSKQYDWGALLKRVEQVASGLSADWFIHHDIDEVRLSPWPGVHLKDGIYRVDHEGFNCIDHTVVEFHPLNNDFVPGSSFEKYFQHFEFSSQSGHFLQIKAWKNLGLNISLAESGGHNAQFNGQKVYPYKFLLKHYPIRSQQHGERKVFYDRKLRWNAKERAAGWHSHYDPIQPGHVFVRSSSELETYDEETFYSKYLIERLSGIGVKRKRRR